MLILASSIPAIAVYFWFRIARYPFSTVRFLLILLAGATAFFPALILQNISLMNFTISGRWGLIVQIFVRIALTEELSRLLVLLCYFKISRRLNSGLTYGDVILGSATGLVAGLGLAILESAAYGAVNTGIILLRLFTAAPLHAACGARAGAAAILFRSNPVQAFFRFLTAVAIHGIYNYMIILSGLPSLAAVLIALSALASSILTIHSGMPKNPPAS